MNKRICNVTVSLSKAHPAKIIKKIVFNISALDLRNSIILKVGKISDDYEGVIILLNMKGCVYLCVMCN
jgi:hypothetical protein